MNTIIRFAVAAAALFYSAAARAAEKNYDFRARLGCLHPPRRAGDAAPVKAGETAVDSSWKIVILSEDPVIRHAADDLADYFAKSMNEAVAIAEGGSAGSKTVSIGIAAETDPLTARVTVTADRIRITGATAREAAQGCYRLEDAMNFRGCFHRAWCIQDGNSTNIRTCISITSRTWAWMRCSPTSRNRPT